MKTSAMNSCPLCDTTPKLAGVFHYQVRCVCGACGPKQPTRQEAVSRWNSVVYFVLKFRASESLERDAQFKTALC
jgi:hypothetical protein